MVDITSRDDIQLKDLSTIKTLRKFLSKKDIDILHSKLTTLQENQNVYEIISEMTTSSPEVQKAFIEAGRDLRSAVITLLLDDEFLMSLRDEGFKTIFFANLDSFAKLAADPTKITVDDAEAFKNIDNVMMEKKSSIWPSKSSCFKAFLAIAAGLAIAALIVSLCTPIGPAVMAAVAVAAVTYAYTAGIAVGAAGITAATPIIGIGVNAVTAHSTAAIATGAGVGGLYVGTGVGVTLYKRNQASNIEESREKLTASVVEYKGKLTKIQKSELPVDNQEDPGAKLN